MTDYQRGLLDGLAKALTIIDHSEDTAALAATEWERGFAAALRFADSAIRAEAEKAAEAPDEALIEEVRAETIESCAAIAWKHYMDTCKSRKIPPATQEHWIASGAIREHLKRREGK